MNYLRADNERLHKMVDDGGATSHPPLSPSSPISAAPIGGGFSLLSNSFSQAGSPSTTSLSSPIHRSYGSSDKSGLDFLSHGQVETDNGKRVTVSVVSEEDKQVSMKIQNGYCGYITLSSADIVFDIML